MTKNKEPLMRTFIIFSVIVYLIILFVGSVSFVFSMQQIIRTNKGNELSQMLDTERIRLESSLNSEIAIALKLADSPLMRSYLMNPENRELEAIALEEIASYRSAFSANSIFWMNDIDRIFYSDDNEPYWVDAGDPVNYWYNMTLFDTEVYNFNINYNPDINVIRLWINAPVFDDLGNPVGMVGTGIELSEFVDYIYRNVDERTELFFFNSSGRIFGSRDVNLIVDNINIADVLREQEIDILAKVNDYDPEITLVFDVPNGIAAVGAIPLLDWYSFASVTDSIEDYNTAMTMLFFVVLVLILLIIILFNVVVYQFVKSLRRASENLAIAARTREQELIADNEMLDRMNKMKNEFFLNMNHDFKTPLNVISTSVFNVIDMCDFELDKSVVRAVLGNAQSEIMRMARMVDSAMKRSELYESQEDMKLQNMTILLSKGAETYRALLERHANTLHLDIPESLPPVMGNTDMLLHVLSNLLSNANRYTRNGNITISAGVGSVNDSQKKGSQFVIVNVKDTGAGIKPEFLPNVFKRGVSDSGTGLGLPICKNAIEAHGGLIGIESVQGKGTTVWFAIPTYVPDEEEQDG